MMVSRIAYGQTDAQPPTRLTGMKGYLMKALIGPCDDIGSTYISRIYNNAPLTIRVRHHNCCPSRRCNRNSDRPHEFHRPLGHVEAGRADRACWHLAEATSASG